LSISACPGTFQSDNGAPLRLPCLFRPGSPPRVSACSR
jgi:hypothetical protein